MKINMELINKNQMQVYHKYFSLLLVVLVYTTCYGQVDENHKTLLKLALEQNQKIQEANFVLSQQTHKVKEVRSNLLPSISTSLNTNKYFDMPTVIIPGEMLGLPNDLEGNLGKAYNLDANIGFSQIVFNLPYLYALKAAKSSVDLYELQRINTEEDVIYQISYAYYSYLGSIESLKILNENKKNLSENKLITRQLIEGGTALLSDEHRIEIKINEIQQNINFLEAAIKEQKRGLSLLVGLENYEFLETIDSVQPYFKAFKDSLGFLKRTELRTLVQKQELNRIKIKQEQAFIYPSISAFGSYGSNAQRDGFNYFDSDEQWNKTSLVGLKVNFSIYSGGKKTAKIQQAKIAYNITEGQIYQAKIAFKQAYQTAIDKYSVAQLNNQSMLKNSGLSQSIYHQTQLKYNEGILPLTELLLADANLSHSKLNYNKSFLELYMAELNVLKAAGNLKELINN